MDGRFDELLLGLAQKHKGIDDLLHTLMTFMERRTDLFHVKESEEDKKGFKQGEAREMLRKQFSSFQARYLARAQPHLLARPPGQGSQALAAGAGYSSSSSSSSPPSAAAPGKEIPNGVNASPLEGGDPGQWERQVQKGEGFTWNQTPQDVTVEIDVPKCKASDLKVVFATRSLSVKLKGEAVAEGKLFDKISGEDSTWHLDNGKQVVITLEKVKPAFWDALFVGGS
eukprot:TRINITY_DN32729_c0_g1_i1.p1 TRINITY_DN32729_c0_g1~~TRINITY_DN32729_c0_g1_i1.p1  ORF type:complete len:227 (-),score=62.09 TRINITY_DN32729_c0_g1_i1:82-762(-)